MTRHHKPALSRLPLVAALQLVLLSPSWWSLGARAYHLLGAYDDELDRVRAGRRLHPRSLRLLRDEARALAALGRVDELLDILERNTALPSSRTLSVAQIIIATAEELPAHGHPDAGKELLESWIEQQTVSDHRDPLAHRDLAEALYYAGYAEEAQGHFEELESATPDNIDVIGYLAVLAVRGERTADAERLAKRLMSPPPYARGRNTVWRARMVALEGQEQQAVRLLEQAYDEGSGFGVWLHRDIHLAALRGRPAFEEFARLRE
jgi:tetratricopeptide (TPR) repeat protein